MLGFSKMLRGALSALAFGLAGAGVPAAAQDKTERAYVFGNSLVHHLTETDETTVPHWLALMSKEAGHDFALSGQWGFLRDFRRTLPPEPNWSFKQVTQSWNSERRGFADAGLTSVWVNPANFIQYNSVDTPFEGDNPDGSTPLGTTLDIFDWVRSQAPDMQLYVYEGWPEMGSVTGRFPPGPRKLADYHAYATGPYAAWYDAYVAGLSQAGPVTLIPVSRVLSSVMSETALEALPAETFYSDDAPHGTAALYLMAAMVTYNTLYAEPVPDSFRPPSTVAPELRATFPMVRDAIWERVAAFESAAAVTAPASAAPRDTAPAPQKTQTTPEQTSDAGSDQGAQMAAKAVMAQAPVENPSLAMGLNGIADWSVQHPFIDLMKTARPWIGHKGDQWGAFTPEIISEGGYLDANGWPVRLPEGARALEAFILTDQPEEATNLAGAYVATYDGQGILEIGGRAQNTRRSEGEITFDYTPGEGLVSIAITKTDPDDPIRNIKIFRAEHRALAEAGVTFNPDFIARIENLRSLRFMDWMSTNGSKLATWDERPTPQTYSYVPKGVPAEVMIELSNLIGADPWFNMPHMADDAFMRNFAELVETTLRPELKAYVEYSNEVWNFIFPQAQYAQAQARERWGRKAGDDAWMQFYGMRTAQMAKIWTDVFGEGSAERLVPVIGTHTGWLGLEVAALYAPLWVAEDPDNWEPYVYVKAYAITGYFGYEMGIEAGAAKVLGWLDDSRRQAQNDAATKGLSGAEADAYVEEHKYDAANVALDRALRDGSVKELIEVIFKQQSQVASDHGLQLVMYEGGTHVAVGGEFSQNEALIEFFKAFNYTSQMAGLYTDILTAWKEAGGTIFNAFVDVAKPSQYGSWGALRHLQDDNPRWDALMAFNAQTPGWWEARPSGTFEGGRIMSGTQAPDTLDGTAQRDVIAGMEGDDVLRPVGGRDLLLGGGGFDAVLLPGNPSDYSFKRTDTGLTVRSALLEADLRDVEMLWFEADEELAIMVEDLF